MVSKELVEFAGKLGVPPGILELAMRLGENTKIDTEEARDYYPRTGRSFYIPQVPKEFYSAPGLAWGPKRRGR